MKHFLIAISIVAILAAIIFCATSTPSTYHTDMTVVSGVYRGEDFKKGDAYLLAKNQTLTSQQSIDGGIVVAIESGIWGFVSDHTFFLKTNREVVDGGTLPKPICARYEGIRHYQSMLKVIKTVHSFEEVSCEPYIQAQEPQADSRNVQASSPSSQEGASQNIKSNVSNNLAEDMENLMADSLNLMQNVSKGLLHLFGIHSDDFLLIPGKQAGSINAKTTEFDLKRLYGSANVIDELDGVEFGHEDEPVSIIFPKDPEKTLTVYWNDPQHHKKPYAVRINLSSLDDAHRGISTSTWKSKWHFSNHVSVGTKITDLQKLNRIPFSLKPENGLQELYSWRAGKLKSIFPEQLVGIDFSPDIPYADINDIWEFDNTHYLSSAKSIRSQKLRIGAIFVYIK